MKPDSSEKLDIWFVYDGECPICQLGARLFKIRQSVGTLHTVDARTQPDHPVMLEVNDARLDLDRGMVIKYLGKLYQGEQALSVMAEIGADDGVFNRINHKLFRYKTAINIGYPLMRFARNAALFAKGIGKIGNIKD